MSQFREALEKYLDARAYLAGLTQPLAPGAKLVAEDGKPADPATIAVHV